MHLPYSLLPPTLALRRFADGSTGASSTLGGRDSNFEAGDQNVYDSYNGIAKVDWNISSKHTVAFRDYGGTGKQAAEAGLPYEGYF